MGQSILRHRRTPFGSKQLHQYSSTLVERPQQLAFSRKGMGLKFPNLDRESVSLRGHRRGNANETPDHPLAPGKSFLFLLRIGPRGKGSTRDTSVGIPKNTSAPEVSGAADGCLEKGVEA
jgi:hypothetical protein